MFYLGWTENPAHIKKHVYEQSFEWEALTFHIFMLYTILGHFIFDDKILIEYNYSLVEGSLDERSACLSWTWAMMANRWYDNRVRPGWWSSNVRSAQPYGPLLCVLLNNQCLQITHNRLLNSLATVDGIYQAEDWHYENWSSIIWKYP